jgi:hypothetical protein
MYASPGIIMVKDETCGACSTHGRDEKYNISVGKPEGGKTTLKIWA